MNNTGVQVRTKTVTKIAANPALSKRNDPNRILRVAAYCRVSTDDEDQLNSYRTQKSYYTELKADYKCQRRCIGNGRIVSERRLKLFAFKCKKVLTFWLGSVIIGIVKKRQSEYTYEKGFPRGCIFVE